MCMCEDNSCGEENVGVVNIDMLCVYNFSPFIGYSFFCCMIFFLILNACKDLVSIEVNLCKRIHWLNIREVWNIF